MTCKILANLLKIERACKPGFVALLRLLSSWLLCICVVRTSFQCDSENSHSMNQWLSYFDCLHTYYYCYYYYYYYYYYCCYCLTFNSKTYHYNLCGFFVAYSSRWSAPHMVQHVCHGELLCCTTKLFQCWVQTNITAIPKLCWLNKNCCVSKCWICCVGKYFISYTVLCRLIYTLV